MNHTQSYIICATPRSGTTLLCDLLADSGVAGRPDSFFRLQSMRSWWAPYLGVSAASWLNDHAFYHSYLAAVLQEGAGGTQVFGMRLMWSQVENLSKRLGLDPMIAETVEPRTTKLANSESRQWVTRFQREKISHGSYKIVRERMGGFRNKQ